MSTSTCCTFLVVPFNESLVNCASCLCTSFAHRRDSLPFLTVRTLNQPSNRIGSIHQHSPSIRTAPSIETPANRWRSVATMGIVCLEAVSRPPSLSVVVDRQPRIYDVYDPLPNIVRQGRTATRHRLKGARSAFRVPLCSVDLSLYLWLPSCERRRWRNS
ncbi:hypothetical protein BDV98DRAFT_215323 [Pterulicium gracile]|uniref:Uncharacterized protein n=1 Tax=Pterulicium gracile TaxID=1884261 RepID=A0A5C3Q801_9AGAR|nr:hypothetical protein BDV98DRAFT_215323 [Pterula gracilis]